MRIVVTGYIVRYPVGGGTWPYLQYAMGLSRLGHDVYYLESSGIKDPYCCFDPLRHSSGTDPSYGLQFAKACFDSVGLAERWSYFDAFSSTWHGPAAGRINEIGATADLLINTPALATTLEPWMERIPRRILLDIDPCFTQIFHKIDPDANGQAARHNVFFSFGENISRGTATVPDDGFQWQATRPPVVLDAWPVVPALPGAAFTTMMNWDSYPARTFEGRRYGMKSESFTPFMDLPRRANVPFELAIGSNSAPREALASHGWNIRDPLQLSRDLWVYQRYIQSSLAEFTVAKQGYVVSRSGWFSDRSAAYLASGRPVITEDTGFSDWLPTGAGVLAFKTPEEALAAIDDVRGRYAFHSKAAREIAEASFDSDRVLAALVDVG